MHPPKVVIHHLWLTALGGFYCVVWRIISLNLQKFYDSYTIE